MNFTRPQVLLIARVDMSYNRDLLRGIMDYTRQHANWEFGHRDRLDVTRRVGARPAGLFLTGMEPQTRAWAAREAIPFVNIGGGVHDSRFCQVHTDERAIGIMAFEHFASLGFKHFAYVGHGPWSFVCARRDSFVAAARERGCAAAPALIGSIDDRRQRPRFERDLAAILQSLPRPCGLMAADDTVGVLIIKTCRNLGLRVPDDIAVLGVDDDQLACQLSEVPLSSIIQPLHAIGYEAARLLHQQMQEPGKAPVHLTLPPLRVAARASTDLIALEDEDVVAALRLINHHMAEPINVDWVVRQLPVARRTLYRKFEALVGRTILQQIHHVRLQKAKELLAESDLSVDVVARRSGFANARWLADCFRQKLGTTPIRYRRQFRIEA